MTYFESVEAQLRSATVREYAERSPRRRWWRRRSGAVVAFAVVAAIATPAVAALSGGWSPPGPWHAPGGEVPLTDVKVAPSSSSHTQLGVLKPATQAALDALPDSARITIMNLRLLRTVPPPKDLSEGPDSEVSEIGTAEIPSGDPVTVFAIDDKICFAAASGAGGCNLAEMVTNGEMFSATPAGCSQRILGFMPDGVDTLLVDSSADGTIDQTIPVTSNVYEAVLPAVRSVLHAPLYSDHPEIKVGLPLGYYGAGNTRCHPGAG